MISCSLGVMAYNEEKNIARALEALLSQKLKKVKIKEIYIIASGCTDRTIPITKRIAKTDKRIKLLIQKKREGKSSAVNLFLKHARSKIVVLVGADTLPQEDVVEKLVTPFLDPQIGMTGAHPIPVDPDNTFFGFAAHLLWELHHQVSLSSPKMGEMVAYRKVFERIPYASVVDEATVEPLIVGQGYKLLYVPSAIVFNKGTENLREFLKQRRRIHTGHLALIKVQGYSVSTLSKRRLFLAWLKSFRFEPRFIFWSPLVAFLEIVARLLGTYDFYFKKDKHTIWEVAYSTKRLK
ncbi:MAG: glycosyltransferase [Patescibacteria group bacterium]